MLADFIHGFYNSFETKLRHNFLQTDIAGMNRRYLCLKITDGAFWESTVETDDIENIFANNPLVVDLGTGEEDSFLIHIR